VKVWVLTLFPEYFEPLKNCGVISRAFTKNDIEIITVNIRDYIPTKHKGVDDSPYGGGPGMVMRADYLSLALKEGVIGPGGYTDIKKDLHIIAPGPRGKVWNDSYARYFSRTHFGKDKETQIDLVFVCGRYEGIDERFFQQYVDEHISIGDYIISGGEIAVINILDSSFRFLPGVLGNSDSSSEDSFSNNLLESPQYTRPSEFEGMKVPSVLLSGDHKKIADYRHLESIKLTSTLRPELMNKN
jgi:tRNA (guanine37-N1)-methyltransferase